VGWVKDKTRKAYGQQSAGVRAYIAKVKSCQLVSDNPNDA